MKALTAGDKGAGGLAAFKSWVPGSHDQHPGAQLQDRRAKDVAAKKTFQMPALDIEDLPAQLEKRLRVDEETLLKDDRGFVNIPRVEIKKRGVRERAGDFLEVYDHKDKQQVRMQAARCMDCGTPFCHQSVTVRSGCP